MKIRIIWLLLLTVVLSSCVPQILRANLYNTNSGEVLQAEFTYNYTGRGTAVIRAKDTVARGEYRTVASGESGWGLIFGRLYTISISPNFQRGFAVASDDKGWFLQCEYITISTGAAGYGTCTDNRNQVFRLIF